MTVVVVLPTPPFWFETVKIRVFAGAGSGSVASACTPASEISELAGERSAVVDSVDELTGDLRIADVSRETASRMVTIDDDHHC